MKEQTQQEKNAHDNGQQLIHSFNATDYSQGHFYGLTKREYFAGLAMQGFLANPDYTNHQLMITKHAIELADELLKQLEK